MALTAARREELAKQIDIAATWMSNRGRSGKLRAIAAELRGEDVDDESAQSDKERLEAAAKAEEEAQEAKAARRAPTRPAADA